MIYTSYPSLRCIYYRLYNGGKAQVRLDEGKGKVLKGERRER